ncbi:NAD(P)/FAD-dependent oxidoreductase [Oscillatoriales cyanobacterium LEGE 11467]|uniref:NAD(P)/FAD-dependent oxidoreductase n=1 Tax=Zarconia navalis LEGE 11467 TaxID=1828826 RepID=A0A928VYH0_9CYAN|nr:NAD(P)/FAD-dependent oxidoreductase [Zarconia navalis]MBE9040453.1 NAD(P)/FAD-dependent oxidoreductase [Zarconia navalis LEGE 11467]
MNKVIAIIGGGSAGMSCALWLKHLGFHPVIIEKSKQLGGLQNINPFHNKWYLGISGKTGKELAQEFRRHMEVELLSTLVNSTLDRIIYEEKFRLFTGEQDITADAIVIATGQRFKRYETIESISGSQQLRSSNHVCFNPGIIPMNYGQTVAIVGGGDNGLGTAIMLAERAKHIHLFVRSQLRGFGMNQQKVLEYIEAGKITLYKHINIHQFNIQEDKIYITFQEKNNAKQELLVDRIFFRMGFLPNIEEILQLFEEGSIGSVELDSRGYIATDRFLRTSIPNVYAAGDVTNPRDPCVATAVAHGAIAARSIEEDLRCDV